MRRPGRYAVVGIPCFIKAIQLLRARRPARSRARHTHAGAVLRSYEERGDGRELCLATRHRARTGPRARLSDQGESRPANWYRAHLDLDDGGSAEQDWWHLADGDWGAGFFQNPACDWCDDVVAETADIAFGDAWVEPYSSDGRGTNVVVVRSREMKR